MQDRVHHVSQGAYAFSVNDAHLENAFLPAGSQVIRHQFLYLLGQEGVQVENAVDGLFDQGFTSWDRCAGGICSCCHINKGHFISRQLFLQECLILIQCII